MWISFPLVSKNTFIENHGLALPLEVIYDCGCLPGYLDTMYSGVQQPPCLGTWCQRGCVTHCVNVCFSGLYTLNIMC